MMDPVARWNALTERERLIEKLSDLVDDEDARKAVDRVVAEAQGRCHGQPSGARDEIRPGDPRHCAVCRAAATLTRDA